MIKNLNEIEVPAKTKRNFLPEFFLMKTWQDIAPYFNKIENTTIDSKEKLVEVLTQLSELEAFLEEDLAWKYIKMNIDTTNEELSKSFNYFIGEIQPKIEPVINTIRKKLVENPFFEQLTDDAYQILFRSVKQGIKLFREENIALQAELHQKEQEYGATVASLTIHYQDKEHTLAQAAVFLKSTNRDERETVYRLIQQKRLSVKDKLDELLNQLIKLRNTIAINAGFTSYTDYKFAEMGRFDYTVKDCFNFHKSIETLLVPIINEIDLERKSQLKYTSLRPWDLDVDIEGRAPLKPFESGTDLLEKTTQMFYAIDTYFGDCLLKMQKMGHLDLESKKGKAPGGFNYPLYESGAPFIYMNSVGTVRDFVTLIHEGGHAIHSFLSHPLALTGFKNLTPEIAEVASMSMELISLDFWHLAIEKETDLKRAKKEHLEQVLETLPWVATVDAFQHWLYANPNHHAKERADSWLELYNRFNSSIVDWEGLTSYKSNIWQKQLHIYEVPFYYIEYGFAQLAAIAVWKNYKENPTQTLQQFKYALSLGYTKSIPEIYRAAGIGFNFSEDYIQSLTDFVKKELNAI
jgi:oligoendopeptidase F